MTQMTVDELLTTTRSVRKRLDFSRPVERQVLLECIDLAVQAPIGGNMPRYHFMVVDDPQIMRQLADHYRRAFDAMYTEEVTERFTTAMPNSFASFKHLAEHFHEIPTLVFACVEGRPEGRNPMMLASLYGCIQPAAWSLMLALRSRGLGSAWTTLNIEFERELKALVNMPEDLTIGAVLPVACYQGDSFKRANRLAAESRTYWNNWGHSAV